MALHSVWRVKPNHCLANRIAWVTDMRQNSKPGELPRSTLGYMTKRLRDKSTTDLADT